MAYIPWNAGTPIGTEPANTIDEIVVEVKSQITERMNDVLEVGGKWDTDDPILLAKAAVDIASPVTGLENLQHWSVGGPPSGYAANTYTTSAGDQGTFGVGIRPTNDGATLIWHMPLSLPIGATITGYKAKMFVPTTTGGAEVSVELFRTSYGIDGSTPGIFSLGSTGSLNASPAEFQNVEISGLSHVTLNTETYYAEIILINAAGITNTWFYAGGPVYDSPGLNVRL